jgi:protein-L-isoaspartate(D-aspartate) O-methyltransferase
MYTNLQKHAMCLEKLKDFLQPGMKALDVGSGSGYLTGCSYSI